MPLAMDWSRWTTCPYYAVVILIIACGSIPKGYDEGGFSASVNLESFKDDYRLQSSEWLGQETALANRKANITSFNVLGAAFGALFALDLNDRLGRLRSWRLACLVWASGLFVQVFSSGKYGLLLAARIWSGLGAGALTVVTPLYLSEIAPTRTRGLVVSVYMVILLAILALGSLPPSISGMVKADLKGFFINYGASLHMAPTRTQYRLVQSIPLIPVGIALVASSIAPETPRYLVSKQRYDEGRSVLARLRGKDITDRDVQDEFTAINAQIRAKASDLASVSHWQAFKETQLNPNYRQRFWLLMVMQTISQWTGGNGITYYVATIFQYAGVTGNAQALVSSGAYGIVKLVFTMAFTWGLIDFFGRRRCALAGLSLQLAAHIYMGAYMGLQPGSRGNRSASDAAIASVFVYAVGWSIGLCTIPYLYGTEIFPTRIRNVSYALSMSLHWFFQFAIVRVTPNMFVSLDVWGAYLFWAIVCFAGLVILGIWMPETKGVPIENMGDLFEGPWYLRWRAKPKPRLEPEPEPEPTMRVASPCSVVEMDAGGVYPLKKQPECRNVGLL
ncbi:putative MFS quinate transporter [Aspergillus clavatus NRRL 1]|uniref:MFS quinate transporter, putative n=1 Tax=Aspergillus clavatus (strain ATCC 1007 / CBS 513.65 / DSM 816 / NCTC 3887 / NRRL 1 / QM 1276 / 107) TaxID=344612 RepID=A1CNK7_ASPCL|nr:MFS quinate transporter, putative [Aspergillus clavatus NRRL 1]EAW07228.1 MFS quinate transporter, putative [Aspergillus clavatus NRRL 1]